MNRVRKEVEDLQPIPLSEEDMEEISAQNAKWSRIADTLYAQLRARMFEHADVAASLHSFYLYSMAMMDCNRYTFPTPELNEKISRLLPLLPRGHRQTITIHDLTEKELNSVKDRIAKRFDMGMSPKKKKVTRIIV